ncbi:unnamed protein product [Effrenium voratum]|uniref:Uncharacterized protein n=1 Tax=Effrenium voratum TaxID=2562239 RepID=A0AA36J2T6_9DINO|nr:unnamed protein product [Effrenium voratum]CAJ1424253.1 unnamed protein product [Effrenium voratum]
MALLLPLFAAAVAAEASAHVGWRLANSPCARLQQMLGDDLQSLFAGLFEDLSSMPRPKGLSSGLVALTAQQLVSDLLGFGGEVQALFSAACAAGAPGSSPASARSAEKAAEKAAARLREAAQLTELELQLPGFPEVDGHLAAAKSSSPDESPEALGELLQSSRLLQRHLDALKAALQASLKALPVLLKAPGPALRARLRRLLDGAAVAGSGAAAPRRRHGLCEAASATADPDETFFDASGAPSRGRSAGAWLRALSAQSRGRAVAVLPVGMSGSVPCANARGVLYDPTSCLVEQGWGAVSLLVEGEEVAQALEQFHVPGVSTQWPIPWPLEVDSVDLLFLHPMAGNCLLLERLLQGVKSRPKLIYVGINPLLPPPLKAAPDFMDHWRQHQELSRIVLETEAEEMDAWAVRSMTGHVLAQCSLSQASELLRSESYVLLQVEHHFAVFAHTDQLPEALLSRSEFQAWQRGWFCSPLAPVLLSLEQLAGFDETWLSIGALPEKEAAQEAAAAACRFLRLQGLRPAEAMPCEDLPESSRVWDQAWQQRLRMQWALRPASSPGLALHLSTSGHGYCGAECECFAPWRGPSCDVLDAGSAKAAARSFQAAVHYIVNEDPVHLAELRHSLRNLWQNYNSRFDYPVQIFHDGLSEETRTGLVQASPNRLWFHHLPKDFLPSVNQLPSELVVEDAERHVSHHTFSVGYRAQCRFRSGPLFEHPAVVNLDYLMSLDTDSMLTRELERDPIEDMHRNSSLVLGYAHLTISSGAYSRGLWAATLHYLAYEGINLTSAHYDKNHFFSRFLTPHTKHEDAHSVDQEMLYHNLVVMTDLELLRVAFFKPGSDYFRFYRFVDELGGFWLYRWGDHAVRGLGTAIALFPHEDWSSTPRLMAYDLKMPYAHQAACFCHGANLKCKEQGQEAAGEVLWPAKKKVWRCVANNTA